MSSAYESKPWLEVERAPERDAARYFDERLSYGKLNDLANRFATLLSDRGVEKGDRVAI